MSLDGSLKDFARSFTVVDAETLAHAVADITEISAEQKLRLCLYRDILTDWNSRMNLISAGDLPRFWSRHCYESAQLLRFLPHSGYSLVDLGSGAGFPGLIISLLRPRLAVTLIESNKRKASFLSHVSRETCSSAQVIASRVESEPRSTDIVITRAFTNVDKTLHLLKGWQIGERQRGQEKAGIPRALLLKGSRWRAELTEARKYWKIRACVDTLQGFAKKESSEKALGNSLESPLADSLENSVKRSLEKSANIVLKIWEWSPNGTKNNSGDWGKDWRKRKKRR